MHPNKELVCRKVRSLGREGRTLVAIDFMAACRWRRRLVLAASAVLVAGGLLLPVDGSAMAQAGYHWGHQAEMLGLINDARTHPEKYPPHGNTGGANMSVCSTPFMDSAALRGTARDHNTYLASQPIAWVNTFPNIHKGSDGRLAWDNGGPISNAGYNSRRAEIVATGFPTAADAIRFWMQDDAPSQWGHRNLILNCAVQEAGADHLQGGPGGHYWTVDMGTR
jgi:hypothetical protein